jgi:L-rhamnose mutarotase
MSRRQCFALDLKRDAALIAEYEARHEPGAVWPEVLGTLRAQGYQEMEIWRVADRLFMIAEVADDFGLRPMDADSASVMQRWEQEMDRYQHPLDPRGPKWAPMQKIFSLNDAEPR